ncbi:MAG: TIR domain-containing protein [Bacteroidaceae bacterium]|nr:TIR domain-containing protein [Bacteroidaceae bacterium]
MKQYDIYISHCNNEYNEICGFLLKKFEERRLRVFFEKFDLYSPNLHKSIQETIGICENVIFLLSEEDLELDSCTNTWLKDDLIWAMQNNVNIIPVLFDVITWPERMPIGVEGLVNYQFIAFNPDEKLDILFQRIQRRLIGIPDISTNKRSWKNKLESIRRKISAVNKLTMMSSVSPNMNQHIFEHSKKDNTTYNNSSGKRQYMINTSTLTVLFGNILDSKLEVIVSSDDNMISMGGGVSGAIRHSGGETIQVDAHKNIPAQLGDVVVTTAGRLVQKYIFHCITIDCNNTVGNKGLQEYIIRRSVDKCLRMMPLLGVESIAFPTIGTGVAHFSLEEVAISMADIITDFLYTTNKKYNIEICLYDRLNKNNIIDYLVIFESIAKNINNHKKEGIKNIKASMSDCKIEKYDSKIMPLGKMAATSPTDEHKVFVSYSREDLDIARLFCEQMDNLGISYWIDVNGKYSGHNFKEIIVDAIESSHLILFLSSVRSNRSTFVIKEISLAVGENKTILPIKLDETPYAKSIRFDLSDIDWIEFLSDKNEESMEKFKYCLQLYLK